MSAWSRQVVKLMTGGLLGLVLLSGRSGAIASEPRLEGWVRLASGQPAAGVQVRLFDLTDPRRSVGTTANEEGYFALAAPRSADAQPQGFALLQNYPNPFNPSTIIPYQLPALTHVRLEVFNVLGQHVATLVDGEQPAGWHTTTWHGTDAAGRAVAAGLYLYRIRGTGPSETRRMVLIDGPVSAPGAAVATEPPTRSAEPEPTYGLTVSGRDVITHVDPDFRTGVGPVEIVVEARDSATSPAAMKVTTSDKIWGDVDANGQVDIFDALLVGLYSLDPSITIPNNGDISLGDVNRDGRIDITDAYLIATYSVNPTDPSLPPGIGTPVIAAAEGKMYWVDASRIGAKIQRANLDGSQIETLLAAGLRAPRALAIDVAGGKMYWIDAVIGGPKIQRANLDGSQVEDLVVTGLDYPDGLALDLAGSKMYWTDAGTNKIQRANLDGTRIEDLVIGLSDPVGLALDIITPDLVAASPSVNPPNPASSQSFTLSVAIHNRGNAPAPPTTVRYYLSTDSTITTDDTEVGTGTVSGLAAPSTIFKLIRLTAPSSPGTYYYGACVQLVSGESDIQNNCSSASEVVVVPR